MTNFYEPGQDVNDNTYLVGVGIKGNQETLWSVQDSLAELKRLSGRCTR